MDWCPLPWPRRAASAAMLEVAAGGGYRVSSPYREVRATSLWPCPCGPLARTAPSLRWAPCSVLSGLSSPNPYRSGAAVLPPGRRSIPRRNCCSPTTATPSATGSSDMHTVGSSVLPPPPLPISFASAPTPASQSGRPARSIPDMLAIRSCESSDRPAARSFRAPGRPARSPGGLHRPQQKTGL
jgi:hypothetical protein